MVILRDRLRLNEYRLTTNLLHEQSLAAARLGDIEVLILEFITKKAPRSFNNQEQGGKKIYTSTPETCTLRREY